MSTSPQSRLNQLFGEIALPATNPPDQVHFSEQEFIDQAIKNNPPKQPPPTSPKPPTAQLNQTVQTALSTNTAQYSDDDDYTNAWVTKPSMRPPQVYHQPMPKYLPTQHNENHHVLRGEHDDNDTAFSSQREQARPLLGRFCQFTLAAKFPYKYMADVDDQVSRQFFANNQFYSRPWDLYYIHPPSNQYTYKPIILVPFAQMQQLVNEISDAFQIDVSVPGFPLTLKFRDDGTPYPKRLGTSTSREMARQLETEIPQPPVGHGQAPPDTSASVQEAFECFQQMCHEAITACKGKGKAGRAHNKYGSPGFSSGTGHGLHSLHQAQRYLGLRPPSKKPQSPKESLPSIEQEKAAGTLLHRLDITSPPSYPFDKAPVLISLDLEAYERAHHLITEVGISTLDTLDLEDLPPGPGAINWIDQIRSRHFRISGREHLVNKDFCPGHPDHFQFGKSEFVDVNAVGGEIDKCLQWPFSVQYKHAAIKDDWNAASPARKHTEALLNDNASDDEGFGGVKIGPTNDEQDTASRSAATNVLKDIGATNSVPDKWSMPPDPISQQRGNRQRNIVIVGHAISADFDFLKNLGSKTFNSYLGHQSVIAVDGDDLSTNPQSLIIDQPLDTTQIYRAWKQEKSPRKLATVLKELGRPCHYMHNGGNDARYTLEALVVMALESRLEETLKLQDQITCEGGARGRREDTQPEPILTSKEDGMVSSDVEREDINSRAMESTFHGRAKGWTDEDSQRLPASVTGHGKAVFATSLPIVMKPKKEDLDDFEAALYATSDSDS
ncbi:hypothetical protein PV10_08626 [Exophiala mesophila]|uniref:Gfd2/YDR514C-like C-terminal domain-containing protein n=1 Tax=Exophiala mesophila TaxID=212818 RepID=A0A0D1Z2P7_EXOME|nr:uncharacterized protein PV10_08626 [Exophiala mesophila]KIV89007.1 hypothetical protein PV10_08626 [Exophiala mesophila]